MSEIERLYQHFKANPKVCTDTREVSEGSIFFALKGENFDGNKFAEQAIKSGAVLAVVDDKDVAISDSYFLVHDVLTTLQDLSKHHRRQFKGRVIGITGSNGKTTTKELMYSVLSQEFNVLATAGNFNNHIGVPLTLLKIHDDHEIAIIEMGANHQKEIEFLSSIAEPEIGMITNIGKAHMEGFGGVDGIRKGKTELYSFIKDNSGLLLVNADDPILMEDSKGINRKTYGQSEKSEFRGSYSTDANGFIELSLDFPEGTKKVKTNLYGSYNFSNMMMAYGVGRHFEMSSQAILDGLSQYVPENNRSQILKKKENQIILDAYNANPSSVELAIKDFSNLQAEKKLVILGDMLELGEEAQLEHQQIIDMVQSKSFDEVYLVGPIFSSSRVENTTTFQNVDELISHLETNVPNGYQVLIKGSRGIKLEKAEPFIP